LNIRGEELCKACGLYGCQFVGRGLSRCGHSLLNASLLIFGFSNPNKDIIERSNAPERLLAATTSLSLSLSLSLCPSHLLQFGVLSLI